MGASFEGAEGDPCEKPAPTRMPSMGAAGFEPATSRVWSEIRGCRWYRLWSLAVCVKRNASLG